MRLTIAAGIVVAMLMAVAAWGYAIDGSDSDWASGWATENVDGQDPLIDDLTYDIYTNRSNIKDGYFWFYFRTMDEYSPYNSGDHAEIWLNADGNNATGSTGPGGAGVTGFDYYIDWDLDTPSNSDPILYEWDGVSAWDDLGAGYTLAARGASSHTGYEDNMFTEWRLDLTAIDNLDMDRALWGAFLEGGTTDDDDLCPDEFDQPVVPEPSSLLLMSIVGLPLFGWYRRRKAA